MAESVTPRRTGRGRAGAARAGASRYGETFDQLADRWAALEGEHDLVHPDRNDCGGVGGCPMMRHAYDLLQDKMVDELESWRTNR